MINNNALSEAIPIKIIVKDSEAEYLINVLNSIENSLTYTVLKLTLVLSDNTTNDKCFALNLGEAH